MIRVKITVLFFMLISLSASLFAQKKDSVNIKTTYTTLELLQLKSDSLLSVDTSLNLLHEYNPAFTFNHFGVNTGIYGSPYRNVLYEIKNGTGFNTGINSYELYQHTFRTVKFFDTYTPFSELFYVQGGNEMQKLNVLHTRNINPFWNVTINYSTNISSEFYGNQTDLLKNKVKNLSLTSRYKSKNGNYNMFASFINNKIMTADIGGIDDTSYSRYNLGDKYYATVFLENVRIEYVEKELSLQHSLKIEKPLPDSVRREKKGGGLYLIHFIQYQKTDIFYKDEDINVDYFQYIYLNNEVSNDSIVYTLLKNELHLLAQSKRNPLDNLKAGIRHVSGRIFQNGHDSSLVYFTGLFDASKRLLGGVAKVNAEYVLSGSLVNDYSLKAVYNRPLRKTAYFYVGAILNRNSPNYIMTLARTNHLQWQNNLIPTSTNSVFTAYENPTIGFKTKLSYNSISNLIYLNELISPVQLNSSLSVMVIQMQKNFTAGRFHFNNHLALQYSTNETALALPLWAFKQLSYFESDVFKGNMNLQAGLSVRIMDDYYADANYAPFGLFHRQQSSESKIYPLVDVFLNARVKRARGFVKFEHVNYGFPQGDYFIVSGYPYKQRSFVFGISWLFFD